MQLNIPNTKYIDGEPIPSPRDERGRLASLNTILGGFEEYFTDATGKIISSNLEAVNVTGYDEWEVIGQNISMFYSEEDRKNKLADQHLRDASQRKALVLRGWRIKKRNVPFYTKVLMTPLFNNVGTLTGYRIVLKDTTHALLSKGRTNVRLNNIKKELGLFYSSTHIGVIKWELGTGAIVYLNSLVEGVILKKPIRRIDDLFTHDQDRKDFFHQLNADKCVKELSIPVDIEGDRWIVLNAYLLPGEKLAEVTLVEITYQKRQEAEIRRLNEELNSLIYHSSHELRAPLSSMLGLIHLLRMESKSENSHHYLHLIENRIHHLDLLLKKITFINDNRPNVVVPVHPGKEIESMLQTLSRNFPHVTVSLACPVDPVFYTDIERFRLTIQSVIENSFAYHHPTRQSWITLSILRDDREAVITISDNGVGIDSASQEHVFKMFFKANDASKGFGLGLYMAKSCVDRIGKSIRICSSPGEGTTVQVRLTDLAIQ